MKYFNKKITFALLVSVLFFVGCNSMIRVDGSDELTEIQFDYKDFHSLDVSNSFKVEIIKSDDFKVFVTCNDNLEEHLDVKLNGNILSLGLTPGYYYGNNTLSAKIYLPEVKKIKASGASVIKAQDLKADNLEIDLSGASKFTSSVNVASLTVEGSGASVINIKGTAQDATVDLSGASSFKGKEMLVSNNLSVDCSGASSVKLTANGTIKADASGASSFYCYGNGSIVKQDSSGASVIKKI